LFVGDHTRFIHKATPSTGGMMKFAKKVVTCANCKTTISGKDDEIVLCKHCKPYEADVLDKKFREYNDLERKFSQLWTQCQRCQGDLHQEVLCAAGVCPIFYMRKKVQKDLSDAQQTVARFDVQDW
jgi:DNA polymerase delta subunit 1